VSHLVIMAAGTGGHVMPGLAVAAEMQKRGWTVSWLGTEGGMENRLVPPTGLTMDRLSFSGMRGRGLWHTVSGAARLFKAFVDARRILRQRRADVVLGMGGYVCLPGGLMAAWLRKPLMLVNADAALLLSNKVLLRFARRVAFGFDGPAADAVPQALVTGNPVRSEVELIPPPEQRFVDRSGPLRVLVVGGSLGARVLNEMLPAALAQMAPEDRPLLTHQTGVSHLDDVRGRYATLGLQADIVPFIDNMAQRLADCDVIVCRAGAITVSELCTAGVASVLVPLVVSTTSHQRDNAQWMAQRHAAIHLPQSDLNPHQLSLLLQGLNRERLLGMAQQARTLARPHAAAAVADEIERLNRP
jgi:UDP-N-acetylglucosamine--N-acetylmuramyl-(pentapeptide) pyrophosphoryl-undecaprenol N-acetylglucosamine transferase